MIWDKVAVFLRFIRPSFAVMSKRPYRPQQVLIANEQPHDVGGLLRLPFPGAVRQPAGDGLVEEEVGGHDGGHGPQVHPVPLLPGDHFTEELQQSLREDRQRHKRWGSTQHVQRALSVLKGKEGSKTKRASSKRDSDLSAETPSSAEKHLHAQRASAASTGVKVISSGGGRCFRAVSGADGALVTASASHS